MGLFRSLLNHKHRSLVLANAQTVHVKSPEPDLSGFPTYQALTHGAVGLYHRRGEFMHPHRLVVWSIAFVFLGAASAKEPPAQVIVWPASGPPVVRFSFGKFKETSAAGKQHNYATTQLRN